MNFLDLWVKVNKTAVVPAFAKVAVSLTSTQVSA